MEEIQKDASRIIEFMLFSEGKYCSINKDEYIFDITTELINHKKEYFLLLQRTSWVMPLNLQGSELYVDITYHTVSHLMSHNVT